MSVWRSAADMTTFCCCWTWGGRTSRAATLARASANCSWREAISPWSGASDEALEDDDGEEGSCSGRGTGGRASLDVEGEGDAVEGSG